jgi:polar amino acid transport system permease protein
VAYEWRFDLVLRGGWLLAQGIGFTIAICLISFVLSSVLALGVVAARRSRMLLLRLLVQVYVDLIRSTPLLIQLVWIYYALPMVSGLSFSQPQAALLALSLYGGAYLSEVFRAGINSIPDGQSDAAHAIGLTTAQAWRRIILPQALVRILPPMASILISMVKESALLSVIGVPELLFQMLSLNTSIFRTLEVFAAGSVLYFLLTYPIAAFAEHVYRRQLVAHSLQRV